MISTLFYSFGGIDLYLGLTTPFAPKQADASYSGKHLKTVEYILGGGTDGNSSASNVTTYFGSGTSTVKVTAGTKSVILSGSNIAVKNAYLDVSYVITAVNMTNENVFFDVGGSSSGGTDARVSEFIGATLWAQSGLSGYQRHQYDVTSFFDRQSDSNWSSGVPVEAGVQITGPARTLTTVKLVVTYESDYSLVPHTETKTVRFPLTSTVAGDRGTKSAACGAAATCSFYATTTIPDAVADGDILDVYVEMHGEVNSGTASNFRVGIRGGSGVNATSTTYLWGEASLDDTVVSATWRPTVGSPNFQRNTTQIYDVLMGTVAMNALGGELVVTYRYSTGAAAQTETVRYFLDQDTAPFGPGRNNFATITPTISNGTLSMKNIWFKVHTAATTTANLTVIGKVGTTTEVSTAIALAATNPRAGDDHTIILDLTSQAGQFWNSTTTVTGASNFSAGSAPVAAEAYFTFTWAGSLGGVQTQTVSFSGAQQGLDAIANDYNNRPVTIDLPETVTKTYRSAYLETKFMHSQATSITVGTLTLGVNASTTNITEAADTTSEAYASTYFGPIASSTFSNGDTIAWTERSLEINEAKSVANLVSFANMVVVTYDADFSQTEPTANKKHLKTVEYILGGGTDGNSSASNVTTYFGSGTSTVKVTAGTKSVILSGSNIAVKNAYLDVSYVITAVNMTNENVFFDVGGSSSGGTDARVSEFIGATLWAQSGLSGYQRHQYDVTSFFDRQSDSNWSSGVPVEAGVQITGPARTLTTVKLVVTYESDYSLVPHTETKTVRFPLTSTVAGDRGTKSAACGAAATCSFYATTTIPDAVADGDILDVYVEMHGEVNSGTASNFRVGIRGGSGVNATSTTYLWGEASLDDTVVSATWRPTVGSPNFQRNTTQIYDVLMGTVAMNALGGELVVTYRYSTGAAAQTETVRYFLDQDTAPFGPGRNNFATITPTISNGTLSMKNIWFKVHTAATTTANLTVIGKVGTTTEVSTAIALAATNPRAGDDHTIILDLTSQAGQFWNSTTTVTGASNFSAGSAPVAAEAYFTFTWAGSLGGVQTQTVSFSGAQQGLDAIANDYNNRPVTIDLPETVTKTYRSAYLETKFMHSQATSITVGTLTLGVNASTTNITEAADTTSEAYASTYFGPIASSTFSNGDTIAWTERSLEINEAKSVANLVSFANMVVVTYDADQEYKFPTFTQNAYRFYVDNGALKPVAAWPSGNGGTIGENTEITAADFPPGNGTNLRLRMSLTVATTTMLASSTQFKLQFGKRISTCGVVASWTDIGAPGSGSVWRGFNATPADGTNLSTNPPVGGDLVLSVSSRAGLYSESNPTLLNPFATAVGEDVEYDWNIQNNNAATDTPYCFRMVKSDGTAFDNYSASYPTVRTAGYTAESKNWRWYDDENNETPTSPLALENTAPANVVTQNILKLRITLNETQGSDGVNQKFMLQYSEWSDFSRGVTDLVGTTTCTVNSIWCYGDGVDTDDDPITTLLLSDSAAKGRHNEAATTTSTSHPTASTATEYEFTIKHAGARVNTTYFFRVWDVNHSRPVPLASGKSYPSLSTQGATLTFTVAGLPSSTVTGGVTTDVGTSASGVPFGTVSVGTLGTKAAQRLTVATDATEGYQVFVRSNSNLVDSYGNTIPDVSGSNASPSAWAVGCASGASGCYGYHSTDGTLSLGSIRFLVDDTYAAFSSTTLDEIMYNSGPVTADSADVIFRVEAHSAQTGGGYTTAAQYIVVPIF